ncbi:MAG: type I DNA topoisomerase [Spirochaetota bacterium]
MNKRVLVIVESPTKAKTIKKFLPSHYSVEASVGHIRDLPKTASEVPKAYKDKPWARLGIDVDNDFAPLYVTPRGKGKLIRELKQKLKEADLLLLATDEDREGESISRHLIDVLKPKIPYQRMVFHEITKKAIEHALETGRQVDMNLVNAQETRRILDRLYGFTVSPLLWKKIAYGLSAGRVQSPGLRLIVDRERERIEFTSTTYWDLKAQVSSQKGDDQQPFEAKLESVEGTRVAGSKDFDSRTGRYKSKSALLLNEEQTKELAAKLWDEQWKVVSVTEKENKTRPAPPFTTSTLQQEANRKLRLSARDTMRTAQRLYERGLITYMRTDSTTLSSDGISSARQTIEQLYGSKYLAPSPRQYSTTSRGAQEAHEAIRPAGEAFLSPERTGLEGRELALYRLIWQRTMATQMAEAVKASTKVVLQAGELAQFSATGTRIVFPGFIKVYVEGKDDPEEALLSSETWLPKLHEGETINLQELLPQGHETKPPARFTEASLVKELEKLGIGRPSTYASIINTLFEREYIQKEGGALAPTFIGFGVVQLLEKHFKDLIEYRFTSDMEESLDKIAVGEIDRTNYLKEFYLGKDGLKKKVERQEEHIKPEEARTIKLPHITTVDGIRIGKYGPYILCNSDETGEEIHASLPEGVAPADLTDEELSKLIKQQKEGPEPIGTDPETGTPVYVRNGRYGPYYQLGEATKEQPKPKRASVPKGKKPDEVPFEEVLKLLQLPRTVGKHPETGKDIVANNGRFGPYVSHNGEFRSLDDFDQLFTVTLDQALELLAKPKGGRKKATVIKELGTDSSGTSVSINSGRYGPYIKYGKKNVGLPKELKEKEAAKTLTLEQALQIVEKKGK